MRIKLGLRARFLLATSGLALILIAGFTAAIQQLIEVAESKVIDLHFRNDFERFVHAYRDNPAARPELGEGYRAFIVNGEDYAGMPSALRAVPPGLHSEYPIDGAEYTLGRRDIGDTSLFLLFDSNLELVEQLEDELLMIAFGAGGTAALIASLVALWLARLVREPVRTLAEQVSNIVPGASRPPLGLASGDPEIDRIARAFEQTLDGYDELVERERDFTRDASHELRTPLAVILTSLELIEGGSALAPEQRSRLGRIRAAAEQMHALAEGLLFLARPHASALPASFFVSDAIFDAIRIQRLASGPQSPAFDVQIQHDQSLAVPRGLLICVINNLLRNAIEHSGGKSITVALNATTLIVEDFGRGIEPATRDGLFAKHVRGEGSRGEGLGLYIVKRICDELCWRIAFEGVSEGGTRFRLEFGQTI